MNCKKSLTRFFYFSLCLILALGILLTGCDLWELKPDSGVNGENNTDTENGAEAELPDIFDDEEYEMVAEVFEQIYAEEEDAEDAEDAPCPQAARLKASTRLSESAAIRWIFMVLLLCCFGI